MRFRQCISAVQLAVTLLVSTPLLAQSTSFSSGGPEGGPWAADADGDGRITRDEMVAYMGRRFGLMDQDGDGLVPVQTMQRMLGHEGRERPIPDASKRRGSGKGFGGPGGPPPGGRPPAGDRADAAGGPLPPPGRAMPWPEDADDDGQIDQPEFLAPALAWFADQDRNGDGLLTADELSPPPLPGGEGQAPQD